MTPYAVINSGNKQYRVQVGDVLELEKLDNPGKKVTFKEVLLFADGDKVQVGTPTLADVQVTGTVLEEAVKGDKVQVFRFKAKSRYRKNRGHRQTYTVVKIDQVGSDKAAAPKKKAAPAKKTAPKKATAKKATPKKTAPKKTSTEKSSK